MNNEIITAFEYRGCIVVITDDDYGQSYGFDIFWNGKRINFGSCGTYNSNYQEEVEYLIDEYLDSIHHYPQWHGAVKFLDHDHKTVGLYYCCVLIKTYTITTSLPLEKILLLAAKDLKHHYDEEKQHG